MSDSELWEQIADKAKLAGWTDSERAFEFRMARDGAGDRIAEYPPGEWPEEAALKAFAEAGAFVVMPNGDLYADGHFIEGFATVGYGTEKAIASARREMETRLRNTVHELKRELREEVGIDAVPDASPSDMRFIDGREVTSIEIGETVRLHWCPILVGYVWPDQNYCQECGDKLK